MPRYKVSLHNGLELIEADAAGPVEAARLWVDKHKPGTGCDIKIENSSDEGSMYLRVDVDTTYRYDLRSIAKE